MVESKHSLISEEEIRTDDEKGLSHEVPTLLTAENSLIFQSESQDILDDKDDDKSVLDDGDVSYGDDDVARADHEVAHADDVVSHGGDKVAQGDHEVARADHDVTHGDHEVAQGDHEVAHGDHEIAHDEVPVAQDDEASEGETPRPKSQISGLLSVSSPKYDAYLLSLIKNLVGGHQVRQWLNLGMGMRLMENASISMVSWQRPPFLIDPHGRGLELIRRMEKNEKVVEIDVGDG